MENIKSDIAVGSLGELTYYSKYAERGGVILEESFVLSKVLTYCNYADGS